MKFNPSNLYISLVDLFAILLAGAIGLLVIYHFYQSIIGDFLNIGDDNKAFLSGFAWLCCMALDNPKMALNGLKMLFNK